MADWTDSDMEAFLEDHSKRVSGDIEWLQDEHSVWSRFRAIIDSSLGMPLYVVGSYNLLAGKLTFNVVHQTVGPIYRLDLGSAHRNPDGELLPGTHKHRWTLRFRDREAYVPRDITADASEPVMVWSQFCNQAKLIHHGVMKSPPIFKSDLF